MSDITIPGGKIRAFVERIVPVVDGQVLWALNSSAMAHNVKVDGGAAGPNVNLALAAKGRGRIGRRTGLRGRRRGAERHGGLLAGGHERRHHMKVSHVPPIKSAAARADPSATA